MNLTDNLELFKPTMQDLISESVEEVFGDNFDTIDEAITALRQELATNIVCGHYVGDGNAEQTINLGFTPDAIEIFTIEDGKYCVGETTDGHIGSNQSGTIGTMTYSNSIIDFNKIINYGTPITTCNSSITKSLYEQILSVQTTQSTDSGFKVLNGFAEIAVQIYDFDATNPQIVAITNTGETLPTSQSVYYPNEYLSIESKLNESGRVYYFKAYKNCTVYTPPSASNE